ncbi:MAG: hypothetical protein WB791_02280 [Waddliaceae bacterium]
MSLEALHGNPFDSHTLKQAIADAECNSNTGICRLFVDKGYRGHKVEGKEVFISGKKKLTTHFKKLLKRRQAIEPIIGHMKSNGKLDRNYLKDKSGDYFNAISCPGWGKVSLEFYSKNVTSCRIYYKNLSSTVNPKK